MSDKLCEILDAALKFGGPQFYTQRVPSYIYANLKNGFGQRQYQQEAFGRFIFYQQEYHDKPKGVPTQLLYHMATGSGKTLVMAGLMLYLYEQGYRNFLFFVNSTNIIDKTRDNFLNTQSSKYLFSESLSIAERQIKIKEVANFQGANPNDINLVFSTIQGLHSALNTPRENGLTYDEFEDQRIVLISDEAHHINAETKKKNQLEPEEEQEILSWEGTVNRIFNANPENILLEFTATADLSVPEIAKKYSDKLLFDYPLKQFRKDGYSKEVKVLQADLSPFNRALQGVLLSQYRRKVFEQYQKSVKPVILFKSKTIKESQAFFEEFVAGIKNLQLADLEKIRDAQPDEVISKVFQYLASQHISLENLIAELKEDFAEDKLIAINSKEESVQKQLAVNSLEDENNEYRAVFAVDKLNEGWDVLNLFDIVRLYDTRDAKDGKPGKTTMAEAQLIGRGARYCPFQIHPDQPFYGRKFDDDLNHELRICEELYYHSAYNPKYIQELNTALIEIGIKAKTTMERPLKLKQEFKETPFYQEAVLFLNNQEENRQEEVFGFTAGILTKVHRVNLKTGYTKSSYAFDPEVMKVAEKKEKSYLLSDFGEIIVRKAINKLAFFQFANLQRFFPHLQSIREFISADYFLGGIKLEIIGLPEQVSRLSPDVKLEAAIEVLADIAYSLETNKVDFKGSRSFKADSRIALELVPLPLEVLILQIYR